MARARNETDTPPCPNCGSASVARIMCGMPQESPELWAKVEVGELHIGGCVVDPGGNSEWHCNQCDHEGGPIYIRFGGGARR